MVPSEEGCTGSFPSLVQEQMSNEQNPDCLGDCNTSHLCGDYNKTIIRIPINQPVFHGMSEGSFRGSNTFIVGSHPPVVVEERMGDFLIPFEQQLFRNIFQAPKLAGQSFVKYCWWLKSCTTWDVWNPTNNGINYLSTGAGFQPSTVVVFYDLSCAICSNITLRVFQHTSNSEESSSNWPVFVCSTPSTCQFLMSFLTWIEISILETPKTQNSWHLILYIDILDT